MSEILTTAELNGIRSMAVYWREVFNRDDPNERQRIAMAELQTVVEAFGPEKVLRMLLVYVTNQD